MSETQSTRAKRNRTEAPPTEHVAQPYDAYSARLEREQQDAEYFASLRQDSERSERARLLKEHQERMQSERESAKVRFILYAPPLSPPLMP
jgi:hypothetical protein